MSTPTKTTLANQEQQQEYALRLSAISVKIRLVELNLIAQLSSIRSQLQDIGRACAEAEKILNQDNEEEMPTLERVDSSSSEESGEGGGRAYFVIDNEEKYGEILRFIIEEEMEDLRAEVAKVKAAEAAAAAKNEEASSKRAEREDEEAIKKQRLNIKAAQQEIDIQREELKRKLQQAEEKLLGRDEGSGKFHFREGELDEGMESTEKAILPEQRLIREQMMRQERLELAEMISVLRLEKECLDRDRTKLANNERQHGEQIEQVCLAQELIDTELKNREEGIQTQQETLEKERLEFELLQITQGEEARKANAEILERDRITQETEARDRETLRVTTAKLVGERTNQREQATWNLEFEKLRARAEKLKEDEAKAIEKVAAAEQKLEEIKALLTIVDKEFKNHREEASAKIDSLAAEHELKQTANHVELKKAIEIAQTKTQELQNLRTQLVEEDLRKSREKAHSARSSSQKNESPTGVDKQSKNKDCESNETPTVKLSHENETSKNVDDKPVDGNESASQKSASIANSPKMDNYVFITPESTSPNRDHALTRDSHNEDYLQDSDSDLTD
ncbi:hypothetical protein IFR05_007129 [Cadophora sp. M221]|nr:hypothetical protein IFR05_007129 [Cadophora sp. M221]